MNTDWAKMMPMLYNDVAFMKLECYLPEHISHHVDLGSLSTVPIFLLTTTTLQHSVSKLKNKRVLYLDAY